MMNITTISVLMSFFSLVISILTFLLIFRLINKVKEEYNVFSDITKEYIIKKKIQNDIDSFNFNNQVKTHVDRPKTQNELNKTQVEILKIATSMPITARDVM